MLDGDALPVDLVAGAGAVEEEPDPDGELGAEMADVVPW